MTAKNTIPDEVWDEQADLYELGLRNGVQIARHLGVSPQTVSRQMKKRGAVKGAMVHQSIKGLVHALDRKQHRQALMALSEIERRRMVREANDKAMAYFMAALINADRQGDLSLVDPLIGRMQAALGVKPQKLSKR